LYSTGLYSDLTISSTAKEYRVYRAIVCPRSDFLAAACRHSFKVFILVYIVKALHANANFLTGNFL
ncbi:hypothetical protein F5883DRAFT_442343, partial [Diaporthe sp. PMI_573]